ncbi:MAG: FlxA-like family protein [Lachnospiraceae bacterium]|nr:FlxA-like family protein [Lachnospiraceae bacterium]
MTNISNVTSNNSFSGVSQLNFSLNDSKTQKLETQITNAKQDLSHLSSESQVSAEEKAKKRQEIQREIDELNRKLKLLREQKKAEAKEEAKKQEEKKIIREEMFEENNSQEKVKDKNFQQPEEKLEDIELPVGDMQKLYATQNSIQQSSIIENAEQEKEGKTNVLKSEIKLDTLHGTNPESKKEELSEMQEEDPYKIEEIIQPPVMNDIGLNENAKIIIKE